MRRVLTLHGIHDGPDEPGYSAEMATKLLAFGGAFEGSQWTPKVTELHWATLAQELAGASGHVLGSVSDYAVDVALFGLRGARDQILNHVERQIIAAGPGCVLLAHSLGTLIAIRLLIKWLIAGKISARIPRDQWPIASLITIGSPLAARVPSKLASILHHHELALTAPKPPPQWVIMNGADRHDVVVTGTDIGVIPRLDEIEGYRHLGFVQLPELDTGGFFSSHTGYWVDPIVIAQLFSLMGS